MTRVPAALRGWTAVLVLAASASVAAGQSLTSVTVSPATVVGGNNVTGTATLSAAAPAGGAVVTLASNNTSAATVPATVTVLAGATSRTFTVTTLGVGSPATVTISGTYASVTQNATLTVNPAGLSTVTVTPDSVVGGNSRTATATLNGRAPPGGAVVMLTSSNPSVATVPPSVTIAAATTSATFTVSTVTVASTATINVSGTYAAVTRSGALTVTPAAVLYTLTRAPTSVVGGNASTGTATLNGPAPAGGAVVSLTSALPATAAVPASVTVPAGATAASFSITTAGVASTTSVNLTATYASVSKTTSISVTAATLTTLSVNAATVVGGAAATGTVRLTGDAAAGGLVVSLSSNAAQIAVPGSVSIAAGANAATFSITTTSVAAVTPATLTAVAGAVTRTASLSATPAAQLETVTLSTTSVFGGELLTGTATLNGPAPAGGAAVSLTSSSTARATVPASVTVAAGARFASFTVTSNTVATSGNTTVAGTYNAVSRNSVLTVTPAASLLSLTLDRPAVRAGTTRTGTLTLNGPAPAGGAVVTLSSSNAAAAAVPASVTIAAGATTGTFAITTADTGFSVAVTLTATYNSVNRTAPLTVTQLAGLAAVTLDRASVLGGGNATGTVTLTGPAPAGGAVVRVFSSNTALAVTPATVTVSAGATTATFTVTSSATSLSLDVLACASYAGGTASAALGVTPAPVILSVALSPASVVGGNPSTGTVTLNAAAPAGGAVVALASSDPAATVPATVTVAAGASTTTFAVTTAGVARTTPVEIAGSYGQITRAGTLSVARAAISTVSLSPATVVGGTNSTGTVTLNGKAPTGGAVVTLSSANATVASVPGTVTVAAGATTVTFTVTTTAVGTSTPVVISAVYDGVTKQATLTVTPPAGASLSSVSVSPASVVGGISSTGTATLTAAAPAGGALVTLSSANPSVAAVPANVTIAAGATSGTFTVTTTGVASSTPVVITGTYSSVNRTATLTVTPAALSTLTVSPTTVPGGSPSTGTVTLTGAAPPAGATVNLSSSDTGAATVPANVTVTSGSTSVNFTVTTLTVAANRTATISGVYASVTKTADLIVTPAAALSAVSLNPTTVLGGTPSTGTVTLTSAAPSGGAIVALSSSHPLAATVPSNVAVLAGSTSATFTVTTLTVATNTTVTITANHASVNRTATLTVTAGAGLSGLSLAPTNVVGGASSTGTVTLTATAPAGGVVVALSSPNPGVAAVPPSVTVAAGASSATFPVTTSSVTTSTAVALVAAYGGTQRSAKIWVQRYALAEILQISIAPGSVPGGDPATATITLSGPAPPSGAVVRISHLPAYSQVVLPTTVTVPAGQSAMTFPVTTKASTSSVTATVSASHGGIDRSTNFSVTPTVLVASSVTLSPSTVTCCQGSTGTVTLSGPAPAGGASVFVASQNTAAATVPQDVIVPAGATFATFPVTTKPVASSTNVSIVATYGAVTRSATLTINPATAALHSLSLSTGNVIGRSGTGGTTVTGTVLLSGPAPAGGAFVTLTQGLGPAVVPTFVTVNAGTVSRTFSITTLETSTSVPVGITASYNSVDKSATLTVHPALLTGLTLIPSTTVAGEPLPYPGLPVGSIDLSGLPPTGIYIDVTSSRPDVAQTPTAITTTGNPTTFTYPVSGVAATTQVTITANCCGTPRSATLTVLPSSIASVTVNPSSVVGGGSLTGTVSLNGKAPPAGAVITLRSEDPGVAAVPIDVTIPYNATSVTFPITTSPVPIHWPVTLTATYNAVTKAASVGVLPSAVADLTISPTSVSGGSPATGTVTLYNPAPPGGAVVNLTSAGGVAAVPSTVSIPAGAFSTSFTVTTSPVGSVATATLTASYAGSSRSTFLNLTRPGVGLLELSRRNLTGGSVAIGTVTLYEAAPPGGAIVTLSSSNPAAASVPASITVAAGLKEEGFTVTTSAVGVASSVTLTASYTGVSASRALAVMPPSAVGTLALSAQSAVGGAPLTATVTLTDLAPPSGATVTLTSSSPSVLVPPSVAIYPRTLAESFRITTSPVATTTSVNVTATWAGGSKTSVLTLTPAPALDRVSRDREVILGGTTNSNWWVIINGPAPAGGASISLSSSDPAATVPASVTVNAGATGSAFFSVATTTVGAPRDVTITASYGGVSRTFLVTVTPAPALRSLVLTPTETRGVVGSNMTLNLNAAAPAGGALISLSSTNPSAASVPSTVTVPAGALGVGVGIATSDVTVDQSATITASYGGTTFSSTLKVTIVEGTLVGAGPMPEGVWTAAQSPYIVLGAVLAGKLTMGAGTTVKGGAGVDFSNTQLTAVGTSGDPVVFIGGAPKMKYGTSTLEHVVVASGSIVTENVENVSIKNVTVSYGGNNGITIQGGAATISNAVIDKNVFGGGGYGIYVWGSATADIRDSTIRDSGNVAIQTREGNRILGLTGMTAVGNGELVPADGVGYGSSALATEAVLSGEETWPAGLPWILYQPLIVDGVLTLAPGSVIKIGPTRGPTPPLWTAVYLHVRWGKLLAAGTSAAPISFSPQAANPSPGAWGCVRLDGGLYPTGSQLRHVTISHAGASPRGECKGALYLNASAPALNDIAVASASAIGLYVTGSTPSISFLDVSQSGSHGIEVSGNTSVLTLTDSTSTASLGLGINLRLGAGLIATDLFLTNNSDYAIGAEPAARIQSLVRATASGNASGTKNAIGYRGGSIFAPETWRYVLTLPWELLNNVTVGSGGALTIEPGVTVKIASGKSITVQQGGVLSAAGTSPSRIRFTSNAAAPTPGSWGCLLFESTAGSASQLTYSDVEFGGGGGATCQAALRLNGSSPAISYSTVSRSSTHGISITAGSPSLDHVTVSNSAQSGIAVSGSSTTPTMTNNAFIANASGFTNSVPTNVLGAHRSFWNDATGPSAFGTGSGQSISSGATYEPWIETTPSSPNFFSSFSIANRMFNPTSASVSLNFGTSLTGNWTVRFENNATGAVVRTFTGSGTTGSVSWNGRDGAGALQPDGTYRYRIESVTGASQTASTLRGFTILDADQLAVENLIANPPFFSPNGDGMLETTTLTGNATGSGVTWTVNVKNSGGTTVRSGNGSGSTISYVWDGKNTSGAVQPNGVYTFDVVVTAAGPTATGSTTVTLASSGGSASITSPTNGQVLSNVYQSGQTNVGVFGTVPAANLDNWVLDYGAGASPTTWIVLNSGTGAIAGGQLGTLQTLPLTNGPYTLRLQVWDRAGNRGVVTQPVTVGNFTLSSPGPLDANSLTAPPSSYNSVVPFPLDQTIVIKNQAGNVVRTVFQGPRVAGSFTNTWDFKDAGGNRLADGLYFYTSTVTAGTYTFTWDQSNQFLNDYNYMHAPTTFTEFKPFFNQPVTFSHAFPQPGQLWMVLTNQQSLLTPTLDLSICNQPPSYCPVRGTFEPSGVRTFRWDGTDDTGAVREDIRWVALYMRRTNFPRNGLVLHGTRPTITNLRFTPSTFSPAIGPQQIEFDLTTYQNQAATITVSFLNQETLSTLRTMTLSGQAPGHVAVTWNGKTDGGQWVSPGGYTVTFTVVDALGNREITRLLTTVAY